MVVVEDHDGGHVGRAQLDAGDHLAVHVDVGDAHAVLAPRVAAVVNDNYSVTVCLVYILSWFGMYILR